MHVCSTFSDLYSRFPHQKLQYILIPELQGALILKRGFSLSQKFLEISWRKIHCTYSFRNIFVSSSAYLEIHPHVSIFVTMLYSRQYTVSTLSTYFTELCISSFFLITQNVSHMYIQHYHAIIIFSQIIIHIFTNICYIIKLINNVRVCVPKQIKQIKISCFIEIVTWNIFENLRRCICEKGTLQITTAVYNPLIFPTSLLKSGSR